MCLYLVKRNSTYYFRRVIPPELRPILGQREFTFSLGTKDKDAAKRFRSAHALRTDRLIDDAQVQLAQGSRPQAVEMPAMKETQIEQDEADRLEVAEQEGRREELADYIAFLKDRLKGSTREMPYELRAFRYILEGHQFDNRLLKDQITVARAEKQELERRLAHATSNGNDPDSQITSERPSSAGAMLDTTIVDLWAAERQPTQKTVDTHRAVARWLYQRIGRKPVDQLTKGDFLKFKTKMVEDGQSPTNIKHKLQRAYTLMQWAADNGFAHANTAAGVTIKEKQGRAGGRLPFDLAALTAIFSSPVFTEGERPTSLRGEAGYWLPLLGLFTGARLEELGQLRPADVAVRRYVDGEGQEREAWFIHIRADEEAGLKLKNAGSERHIPVHAELARLGFIDFVTAAKAAKQDRLFPLLRPDKYGRLTAKWGENWSMYRRKVCGVADRRMVFHSFRHTFKDYARLAEIPEGVQRQLMGHSGKDVADDYGAGHWDHQLVQGMRLYKVPGLEISCPAAESSSA